MVTMTFDLSKFRDEYPFRLRSRQGAFALRAPA